RIVGMGHREVAESSEPTTTHLSKLEAADPLGQLGYVGELAEFCDCVRYNRRPAIGATARDGTRATQIALACFESIRTGRTVEWSAAEPEPPASVTPLPVTSSAEDARSGGLLTGFERGREG